MGGFGSSWKRIFCVPTGVTTRVARTQRAVTRREQQLQQQQQLQQLQQQQQQQQKAEVRNAKEHSSYHFQKPQ